MKDLKKKFRRLCKQDSRLRLKKAWPFIFIFLIVSVFFWKFFLLKQIPLPGDFIAGVYYPWLDYKWGYAVGVPVKNPITTDVVSLIFPEQMLGIDLIKSGQWPLWNRYILTGTPLLANLQAASFSPTVFVYFLFDKLTAWGIQILLQHVLAAAFTYLLLRHWKVSKIGAIFGGIAFAFSGFNLIFSQWNGHTLASSFIPLTVMFSDRWLLKGRLKDGVGLTISLAFQLLSGYPQVSLYTAIALGILWLVRICENRNRIFVSRTISLGIFGLLALGLSAIQNLPALELWTLSQRGFEPNTFEWTFLPWSKIITFLAPDYFGNHATANYWGPQDYTSNTGYIGVVVFVFALLSLNLLRKNKAVVFLFLLSIFSLILSFSTPLSVLLWEQNIMGMQAASAHRATILFTFGMALLSGFGIDYFLRTARPKIKKSLLLPYLIIGGFGITTLYLFLVSRGNPTVYQAIVRGIPKYAVALRNLVLPTVILLTTTAILCFTLKFKKWRKGGSIALFLLMTLELFRFGWKFTPFSSRKLIYPETPVLNFLTSQEPPFRVTANRVIPVNLRTPYKLDSLEGYETIHPLRISQFIAALNSGMSGATPTGRYGMVDNDTSHLLDMVNTKYYLTLKRDRKNDPNPEGEIPDRFKTDRFELAFEDKTTVVLRSKSALSRAFMVYDWEILTEGNSILDQLLDEDFPMNSKIIVEDSIPFKQLVSNGPDISSEVEYLKYDEQESLIEVETERDGLLFVSDAHFPGWKAFIDGVETKIYRANFAFRAVAVPSGVHRVRFIYRPESLFNGLKISGASMLLLFLLFPLWHFLGKAEN
jgi:hypothetical protein